MDVLEKIRRLQKERGWSEKRLAEEADISQSTINSLYQRNHQPTIPTLAAICRAFGMTLSQFLADDNIPADLTDEQQELLKDWSILSQEKREALLALIKVI